MAFSVLSHISGRLDDPQKRSVGMLDLGGGSTQITFLPRTEVTWACTLLGNAAAGICNCSDFFPLETEQEFVSVATLVSWWYLPFCRQSQRCSQLFVHPLCPALWVSGACGESARAALSRGGHHVHLNVLILDFQFVQLITKNSKSNAVNAFQSSIWPTLGFKNTVGCLLSPYFWFSWVHSVANECHFSFLVWHFYRCSVEPCDCGIVRLWPMQR